MTIEVGDEGKKKGQFYFNGTLSLRKGSEGEERSNVGGGGKEYNRTFSNMNRIVEDIKSRKNSVLLKNKFKNLFLSEEKMKFDELNNEQTSVKIKRLKDEIKMSKKKYKEVYEKYMEQLKRRTQAQQLIQKCIEDLQMKQKQMIDQYNFDKFKGVNSDDLGYTESLNDIDQKINMLTFIYDNGIMNLPMNKTGLFNKK